MIKITHTIDQATGVATYSDGYGNEILIATPEFYRGSFMQFAAVPNSLSNLPKIELQSLRACELYAAAVLQHLLDTGH